MKLWSVALVLVLLSLVLFAGGPRATFGAAEKRALLDSPYFKGGVGPLDAIHRDAWGASAAPGIEGYRPFPLLVSRLVGAVSRLPFAYHFVAAALHGLNAAILARLTFAQTGRRGLSWLCAALFAVSAISAHTVARTVGLGEVLGVTTLLLALSALLQRAWVMPFGVFAAALLGLFCGPSGVAGLMLVPVVALVTAPRMHPDRPAPWGRAGMALFAGAAALLVYGELRHRWFPGALPATLSEGLAGGASRGARAARALSSWMNQTFPPGEASVVAGNRAIAAMRGYGKGIAELIVPRTLNASAATVPLSARVVLIQTIAGAVITVVPSVTALILLGRSIVGERAGAAARASDPEPYGRSRPMPRARVVGLVVLGLVALAVGLEHFVLHPRGQLLEWRGLAWWVRALILSAPVLVGAGLVLEGGAASQREPRRVGLALIAGIGAMTMVLGYFLPLAVASGAVGGGAERLFYVPALGAALIAGALLVALSELATGPRRSAMVATLVTVLLGLQGMQAWRLARSELPGDRSPQAPIAAAPTPGGR